MTALATSLMTVDEYLAWVVDRPGRHELFRGEIVAMSPETSGHAEAKYAVQLALSNAIRNRELPCHMLPGGMTVRIDNHTAYEPDALVYCGPKLPATAIEVLVPMILVEVLSPSTRRIDVARKLADYFRLPSVAHYLIVDLLRPLVVHHARGIGDTILTRIVTDGAIHLDPPGLELAVADLFSPELSRRGGAAAN